jgi:hypothetical protein
MSREDDCDEYHSDQSDSKPDCTRHHLKIEARSDSDDDEVGSYSFHFEPESESEYTERTNNEDEKDFVSGTLDGGTDEYYYYGGSITPGGRSGYVDYTADGEPVRVSEPEDGGHSAELNRELVVEHVDNDDVSGEYEVILADYSSIESIRTDGSDEVYPTRVTGSLDEGVNKYLFDGSLGHVEREGPLRFWVDGELRKESINYDKTRVAIAHRSYLDVIQENYEKYMQKSDVRNRGGVVAKTPEDAYYPLQSMTLADIGGHAQLADGPIEREHLLEYSNSLPSISWLPQEDLLALPVELMELLKVGVTRDHIAYWERAYRDLRRVRDKVGISSEMLESLELLVRISIRSPAASGGSLPSGREHAPIGYWSQEAHTDVIIGRSEVVAAYLSYPVLEHFVKWACEEDINLDGTIKQGKTIERFNGDPHTNRCSRIGHLLNHLELEIAGEELRKDMEQIREKIGEFYRHPDDHIYGFIDNKRNRISHGEGIAVAEYGTILNLISLIISHEIDRRTS